MYRYKRIHEMYFSTRQLIAEFHSDRSQMVRKWAQPPTTPFREWMRRRHEDRREQLEREDRNFRFYDV